MNEYKNVLVRMCWRLAKSIEEHYIPWRESEKLSKRRQQMSMNRLEDSLRLGTLADNHMKMSTLVVVLGIIIGIMVGVFLAMAAYMAIL